MLVGAGKRKRPESNPAERHSRIDPMNKFPATNRDRSGNHGPKLPLRAMATAKLTRDRAWQPPNEANCPVAGYVCPEIDTCVWK
jgi:hypothetical protein